MEKGRKSINAAGLQKNIRVARSTGRLPDKTCSRQFLRFRGAWDGVVLATCWQRGPFPVDMAVYLHRPSCNEVKGESKRREGQDCKVGELRLLSGSKTWIPLSPFSLPFRVRRGGAGVPSRRAPCTCVCATSFFFLPLLPVCARNAHDLMRIPPTLSPAARCPDGSFVPVADVSYPCGWYCPITRVGILRLCLSFSITVNVPWYARNDQLRHQASLCVSLSRISIGLKFSSTIYNAWNCFLSTKIRLLLFLVRGIYFIIRY